MIEDSKPAASAYRRPVEAASLAENFRVFADAECAIEPLYAALSRAIAEDDDTLALLLEAPYAQRRPVLLFAVTHDLLLSGVEHPLARFYRSVAPASELRGDVDRAFAAFADFCRAHHDALLVSLRERSTQTNEVGRCAGLRLMLAGLSADRPIALIDVGCSAGLNLLVDRYHYEYRLRDTRVHVVGLDSSVVIHADFESDIFPFDTSAMPPIIGRCGIDLAPLDIRNASDTRWLRACVWPNEVERHERLGAAIELARHAPLDLHRGDASACLAAIVEGLDRDVQPVIFHSWTVSYFDRTARTRFVESARAIVRDLDGVWISAESAGVVPGLDAPSLPDDASLARREATIWHVTTRTVRGACEARPMARTHAHCRWIEWLA